MFFWSVLVKKLRFGLEKKRKKKRVLEWNRGRKKTWFKAPFWPKYLFFWSVLVKKLVFWKHVCLVCFGHKSCLFKTSYICPIGKKKKKKVLGWNRGQKKHDLKLRFGQNTCFYGPFWSKNLFYWSVLIKKDVLGLT